LQKYKLFAIYYLPLIIFMKIFYFSFFTFHFFRNFVLKLHAL